MSLADLITDIENETWKITEDTDLTTVIRIKEELAACEQNEARAKLFGDARQLADVIIKKYLALDQEDRQKMADVYETEECFERIGALLPSQRHRFLKILGNRNFLLLRQISNYNRLIPILEEYIHHVETSPNIKVGNSSLLYYLYNYPLVGEEANSSTSKSLARFIMYNFVKNKKMSNTNKRAVFKSLTYGVPEDLKQRVKDAMSLLPVRKKILENYVYYISNDFNLNMAYASLRFYLSNFNLDGKRVTKASKQSLNSFTAFDFKKNKTIKKITSWSIFNSLTYRISVKLRKKVRNAMTLLPIRKRILENYLSYINNTPNAEPRKLTLSYYMFNFNMIGKPVESMGPESLMNLYYYDFCKGQKVRSTNLAKAVTSMLYSVKDEDLIAKVRKYNPRNNIELPSLAIRTKVLRLYVKRMRNRGNCTWQTLTEYLRSHSISGREVEPNTGKSLALWTTFNFIEGRKWRKKEKKDHLASLAYGINDTQLINEINSYNSKVKTTKITHEDREKVLRQYVRYNRSSENRIQSIPAYLDTHNMDGQPVKRKRRDSLTTWNNRNFAEQRQWRPHEERDHIRSLLYGIKNQRLVKKVKLYNSGQLAA